MGRSNLQRGALPFRLLCEEAGQSLIELALALPLFFFLTFGFIYLCLIAFSINNANFGARAALRYATLHSMSSYAPATQPALKQMVGTYILAYPSNNYDVTFINIQNGGVTTNTVGTNACIVADVTYTFNVLGHSYDPILYNTVACGTVLQ